MPRSLAGRWRNSAVLDLRGGLPSGGALHDGAPHDGARPGETQPDGETEHYTAEKAVILSDLHMGCGRGDDLARNGTLVLNILEKYYLHEGWFLILNGDIEELFRFSLAAIREKWAGLFSVFDRFAEQGRLCKTVGNHDAELLREKNYPYRLYDAVRVETAHLPLFVYHGHQSSRAHTRYNSLMRGLVRYICKPFGIKNISASRSPRRRFSVEKKAYDFARERGCVSVIAHTHRALFESLGRFDFIRFEIERLCRDYPEAAPGKRERIGKEVAALREELSRLKKSERRDVLRQSLYGEDLCVPCLFNSGSAISRKGLTALEIDNRSISLVYWFNEGQGRKFISRGAYSVEALAETPCRRAVLNSDRLDYIKARIELLGGKRR